MASTNSALVQAHVVLVSEPQYCGTSVKRHRSWMQLLMTKILLSNSQTRIDVRRVASHSVQIPSVQKSD